jgi:hypothetical protein
MFRIRFGEYWREFYKLFEGEKVGVDEFKTKTVLAYIYSQSMDILRESTLAKIFLFDSLKMQTEVV